MHLYQFEASQHEFNILQNVYVYAYMVNLKRNISYMINETPGTGQLLLYISKEIVHS